MRLSVIIPCYNEKATIRPIVEAVKAAPYQEKEIIIVDDCSCDGTREELKAVSQLVDHVLYHDVNSSAKEPHYGRASERPPAIL